MLGCVVKTNQVDSGGFDADSDDVGCSSFRRQCFEDDDYKKREEGGRDGDKENTAHLCRLAMRADVKEWGDAISGPMT